MEHRAQGSPVDFEQPRGPSALSPKKKKKNRQKRLEFPFVFFSVCKYVVVAASKEMLPLLLYGVCKNVCLK